MARVDTVLTRQGDVLLNTTGNGRVHYNPISLGFQLMNHDGGVDKEILNINWGGDFFTIPEPSPRPVSISLLSPRISNSSWVNMELSFRVDNIQPGTKLHAVYRQFGMSHIAWAPVLMSYCHVIFVLRSSLCHVTCHIISRAGVASNILDQLKIHISCVCVAD